MQERPVSFLLHNLVVSESLIICKPFNVKVSVFMQCRTVAATRPH